MTWVRYDDELPYNRKVAWLRAHGPNGIAALGLHLLANAWSRHEGMQGFIPSYIPEQLAGRGHAKMTALLVEIHMFIDSENGWTINDYDDFGDRDDGTTAAERIARHSKVRAEAGRLGGLAKASNARSKPPSKPLQSSSPVPVPLVVSVLEGERPETLREAGDPKPPKCQKHPDGDFGGPCGGCKRVREWCEHEDDRITAADERAAILRRERCPRCHGGVWLDDNTKCDHRGQSTA